LKLTTICLILESIKDLTTAFQKADNMKSKDYELLRENLPELSEHFDYKSASKFWIKLIEELNLLK